MNAEQLHSFREKLYNLPSPEDTDINKWCDIVELLCIISPDKEISKGDIKNYIIQDNIGSNIDEQADEVYEEEKATFHENEILQTDLDIGSEVATIQDNISQFVNSWFDLLKYREAVLNDFYPFIVDDNLLILKQEIDQNNRFYLYLLLASNLRMLDKASATHLALDFELFAFHSFGYLFPELPKTKKYIFGKGKYRSAEFRGLNKYQFLKKLAVLLNTELQFYINEGTYSLYDTGEEGLDLVGWIDFDDINPGKLIVFGQCACGVKWEDKIFESSELNWETIINCSVLPNIINTIFIPRFFRNADGWQRQDKIKRAILFDRYRIIKCTALNEQLVQLLPSSIIDALLQ